jgi:hypothetical protein
MTNAMAVLGVIIVISGITMASISYQCQTHGEFRTAWWSGKETHYVCKEKK